MFGGNLKNILSVLAVLMSVIAVIRADDYEDDDDDMKMTVNGTIEMMEGFGSDCEPKLNYQQMRSLVLNEDPVDRDTMCFRHCMLVQFEMMDKDPQNTQMIEKTTLDLMNMFFSKREDDLKEMVSGCNAANKMITDGCEAAQKHAMCLLEKMKEKNFEIPELQE